jgi:hypothetical protein
MVASRSPPKYQTYISRGVISLQSYFLHRYTVNRLNCFCIFLQYNWEFDYECNSIVTAVLMTFSDYHRMLLSIKANTPLLTICLKKVFYFI